MTALHSPSNIPGPATVRVTLDNALRLNIRELQSTHREMLERIRADMVLDNPEYLELIRLGKRAWGVPEKIALYQFDRKTKDLILPRGYQAGLLSHLVEADLVWEISDQTVAGDPVKYPRQAELRDYQEEPVRAALDAREGVIVAPTGAGKTVVGLGIVGRLGRKALWVTHTIDLAQQTLAAAETHLGLAGYQLGLIGDGKRQVGSHLTVGLVQTLGQQPLQDWPGLEGVGIVILDEAHHCPARTFREVIAASPARYRIGLTATPKRADGLEPVLYSVMGPTIAEVTSHELMDLDRILKPVVIPVKTGAKFAFERDLKQALRDAEIQRQEGIEPRKVDPDAADGFNDVLARLSDDEARNQLISELVSCECLAGHSVLVLSPRINHLETLYEMLVWRLGPEPIRILTGQTRGRAEIIESARRGDIRVLLATQLADEGLDIPVLDRLVLAMPKRAGSKAIQQIGRILRPAPGKTDAVVYDLVDDVGVLLSQWRSRRREYLARGFEVREFISWRRLA